MPHTHDRLCFTVETFIVHGNRVLLRMHEKYRIWLGVGGHIEPGEDPSEAAIREAKEETGLDIALVGDKPDIGRNEPAYRQLVAPAYVDRHRASDTNKHVTFRYFARASTDAVDPQHESDRSDTWKWFTREEIDDPASGIRDTIRYYAKAALDAVEG